MKSYFILYVSDQSRARRFYSLALARAPVLDVPGMTEFALGPDCALGLMPWVSIKRLLGDKLPAPEFVTEPPRCEVYLLVDAAQPFHDRALAAGAVELSPLTDRDWGHRAAYSLDPDGHVLAFAENMIIVES